MSSLSRGSNRGFCAWPTLAVASVVLLALAVVLFVTPAATYTAMMPHDLFVYFDAMHRMSMGQRPHVDFHTPHGWLVFALPFLGHVVLDQLGGALEFGNATMLAILLPLAVVALRGRTSTGAGVLLLVALFAIVCAPWPLGASGFVSTQVIYYNRWGWALLTTLLLFGLPASEVSEKATLRRTAWVAAESTTITCLLSLLLFVKATYFAVGLVFVLLFGVLLGRFRRRGGWGLAGFALVVLAAQGTGGWVDDYVGDLLNTTTAVARPGAEARDATPDTLAVLQATSGTLGLTVFACAIAGLSSRLAWRDVLFAAFVLASCVGVATQNSNAPNILFALLALFVGMAARCPRGTTHRRLVLAGMWILLLPMFSRQLLATAVFLFAAHGGCPDCGTNLPRMERVWLGGLGGTNAFAAGLTADTVSSRDALLWSRDNTLHSHMDLSNAEYLHTLRTGLTLLNETAGCDRDIVATMDYVNAFPIFLNVPSPKGMMLSLHVGRNCQPRIDRQSGVRVWGCALLDDPPISRRPRIHGTCARCAGSLLDGRLGTGR